MNPQRTFLFVALFAVALLAMVSAQDNNEIEQYDEDTSDDDNDGDNDDGDRESRQAVGYAFQAPSGECIRAWREPDYCGGFRGGNQGSCDRHCLQRGFPLSWCRQHYCLCHRGKDLGRECEVRG